MIFIFIAGRHDFFLSTKPGRYTGQKWQRQGGEARINFSLIYASFVCIYIYVCVCVYTFLCLCAWNVCDARPVFLPQRAPCGQL